MHISSDPIQISSEIQKAHHAQAGALVIFSGEVRNHNEGKEVLYLTYESHESLANQMIAVIIAEAISKFQLHYASCIHRIGKVAISETAIVVITSASHREAAYLSNQYIVDRVKYEAPIWKKEYFSDGTQEWGRNSLKKYIPS